LGKSASSPSLASSRSSETKQQTYAREVADYTAEFVKSTEGSMDGFRVKIGKLAADAGLANWQDDKSTYISIGKGLHKADLAGPQYEAFKQTLSDGVAWKKEAIAEGYSK
jgi:hypothetical protein